MRRRRLNFCNNYQYKEPRAAFKPVIVFEVITILGQHVPNKKSILGFCQSRLFSASLLIKCNKVIRKSRTLFIIHILIPIAAITALPLSYVNAEPSEQGLEESCSSEHANSGFPPYCFRTGPPTPSCDAFDNRPINPPGQEDDPRQGRRQDPPGQQEDEGILSTSFGRALIKRPKDIMGNFVQPLVPRDSAGH
jgi:hypothetical protein